jgi:hypothetical protein
MGNRHYVAVHTDTGCIIGCAHKHQNVTTAAACISEPGGYVVAVRRRKHLPLTEVEEAEFQEALYGRGTMSQKLRTFLGVLNPGEH